MTTSEAGGFGIVSAQRGRLFAPFHHRERNVDLSQHIGDQAVIEEARFSWWTRRKKAKVGLTFEKVIATIFWDEGYIESVQRRFE